MATTVTLKSNAIDISGSTSGTTTLQATAVAGTTTITLPAATDTLVGKATTDTLTNKTLTSPTISSLTSAAATALTLQSAGTTAITVDTSQNVGIGTSSPSYKLDVRSTLAVLDGSSNIGFWANGTSYTQIWQTLQSVNDFIIQTAASKYMSFGTNSTERMRIDSSGNVLVTGAGGLGYGTGSGGTVTQATSKVTSVTLNKPTGQITMNAAALASGAIVSFTLSNSIVANGDNMLVNLYTGGTLGAYTFNCACGAGVATISVRNATSGSLSEGLVLIFSLIKSATS